MTEPTQKPVVRKEPVAWRVRDFADGWILNERHHPLDHYAEPLYTLTESELTRLSCADTGVAMTEPNVRVTDEMVEAAMRANVAAKLFGAGEPRDWVRAALEAALSSAPVPPSAADGKVEAYLQVHASFGKELSFPEPQHRLTKADMAAGWSEKPLYASPPARHSSEEVERLRAVLRPFADIADFMDTETTGFAMTDELSLICRGDDGSESALFHDFKVSGFYAARAALQRDAQGDVDGSDTGPVSLVIKAIR